MGLSIHEEEHVNICQKLWNIISQPFEATRTVRIYIVSTIHGAFTSNNIPPLILLEWKYDKNVSLA